MQIGNNGTRTYEYNTAQRPKDDNSYSSFVVDTKSVKENATLLTKNLIKFIKGALFKTFIFYNKKRLYLIKN